MGLIKAAKDALGSLVKDEMFLEYFYCTSMNSDTLMVKGQKRITEGRNSNEGTDNIISNGSVVSVNAGQCMIIVEQGKITDFCAEPGEYVYESSSEPSLWHGNLGENVKNSFLRLGRRFTFGGNTAMDQRVYYINTKEILDNLYGTATPIAFHLVSPNTGLELETTVKCNGKYSFKIVDPIVFYTNIAGNVEGTYAKNEELMGIMKSELLTKLPMALSQIAAKGVLPYQVPAHMDELTEYLKVELNALWTENRGIEVASMTMAAPIVPQEDMDKLNKWNETAVLTNANMAAARQTEAYTKALENMGNGGGDGEGGTGSAMNGAMGMMAMGMMQNMMNNGMGNMFGVPQGQQGQQGQTPQMNPASTVEEGAVLGWTCSCGKADNRGRFCQECGLPKPALDGWTCACGHVNQGKFCQECGKKKPEGAPMYRCDKCGWEPEDPTNPPKFCPECGDIFDDNDKI